MTMVSGVQGANYGYVNRVSKREQKLDEKVFAEAQKQVKKAEVRNADWGLYAAQNCLARDLVNAEPDECELIMKKMDYIQSCMNKNIMLDADIYNGKTKGKSELMAARSQMLKTGCDGLSGVMNSTADVVKSVPKFSLVA